LTLTKLIGGRKNLTNKTGGEMKTVYWANLSSLELQQRTNLLVSPPKNLISDLFEKSINGNKTYNRCPANKTTFKNTYYLQSPLDFDITFNENNIGEGLRSDWLIPRSEDFHNRITAEIDMGWLFFCEESLILEMTPPYSHHTTVSRYGSLSVGSFDIGKWFRPLMPAHFLWENERRFVIKADEPLMYIRFLTDEKIKLQQFELTQKIIDIKDACVNHPNYFKEHLPISLRYALFRERKIHKILMKEIKNNLIG
jgi:hypothetical protein